MIDSLLEAEIYFKLSFFFKSYHDLARPEKNSPDKSGYTIFWVDFFEAFAKWYLNGWRD